MQKGKQRRKKMWPPAPIFGSVPYSGNYLYNACFSSKIHIPGGQGFCSFLLQVYQHLIFRDRFPRGLQPGFALRVPFDVFSAVSALRQLCGWCQQRSPGEQRGTQPSPSAQSSRERPRGHSTSHGKGQRSFSEHLMKFLPHPGHRDGSGLSSWELAIRDVDPS